MQALLVVDIQNDYFPGGAMELAGSPAAGARAGLLLRAFRDKGLPVIHIRHVSTRPGSTFFLPGTAGAEIHECVRPLAGEPVFQKHAPNSFRDTPLLTHLRERQVSRLVVAGMMTHLCIDTTVRAAFDFGFGCVVAHDACATRSLAFNGAAVSAEQVQTAFLAALGGVFAQVLPAEAICRDALGAPRSGPG